MGRHLHTLGYCEWKDGVGVVASEELRQKVKHKVVNHATNRDKYECAIGIDLMVVYRFYSEMERDEVAAINELGTVIVFVDVPPACLVWGVGREGPLQAVEFWNS